MTIPGIREVSFDAIGPDQPLLLGRIRLTILDFDRTGDAFIRTNANEGEALLPPEGEVAWVLRRPSRWGIRLIGIATSTARLFPGRPPILAAGEPRAAISYFGTINIKLEAGLGDNRASGRVGQSKVDIVDDHRSAMMAFVEQNPRLAGRPYHHVLRGKTLEAPRPRS